MDFLNQHILLLITALPTLAAAFCWIVPKSAKIVSFGGSVLTFLLAIHVWSYFDGSTEKLQFAHIYPWIPDYGIQAVFGIDGLSLLLVVLTTFLIPLIILSQWKETSERTHHLLGLILILESGMLGSLLALDLVFFYVFWEAMLIPMYFIIGMWGGKRRVYATTKFVLYTVFGSLLMLAAGITVYVLYQQQTGTYSTNLLDLYQVKLNDNLQIWLFGAFALAFAIKVPVWPFHTWLPDAHVEAPTVGSVVLAGVLLKLGTYGLVRFAMPLFPQAVPLFVPIFLFLGVVGIIYGALTAWVQGDAKKMVAYSSVSHLGFVVIGIFAISKTGEFSLEAFTGAMYQMINHGISTGALFFLVGTIYERRHTRMLKDFGGLAGVMPWFATFLIIATLGSVGLPGTGGFVGEFFILLGTFKVAPFAAVFAATGVLLGAVYMLTLCRKILFGPCDNPENKALEDLKPIEWAYLLPLMILVIAMGIAPNFFLGKTKASMAHFARNYSSYRLAFDRDLSSGSLVDSSK